jgi:hypothetical protein
VPCERWNVDECDQRLEIRDRFRIDVFGREFPESEEFWDRNWLVVDLSAKDEVSAVQIRGPYLHATELRALLQGVRDLLKAKASEFHLQNMEPMIRLSVEKRDELGHFEVQLALQSEVSHRSTPDCSKSAHRYEFGIDQTDLQILERQLVGALDAYPVIGQP